MRLRVASSGTHSSIRSSRSPSSGISRPSRLTCGQSDPHTMRSGACLTSACAIGVTDGYGTFCSRAAHRAGELEPDPAGVEHLHHRLHRRLIDAAGRRDAGEMIEHDVVLQRQQLVGVFDDVGAVRIELDVPAVLVRRGRDARGSNSARAGRALCSSSACRARRAW